jgi:hypothetical protein
MAVEKGFADIYGYVILLGNGVSGFVHYTKPVAILATSHGGTIHIGILRTQHMVNYGGFDLLCRPHH